MAYREAEWSSAELDECPDWLDEEREAFFEWVVTASDEELEPWLGTLLIDPACSPEDWG